MLLCKCLPKRRKSRQEGPELRGNPLWSRLREVGACPGGLRPPDGGELARLAEYRDGSEALCLLAGAFCVAPASSSLLQGPCMQHP